MLLVFVLRCGSSRVVATLDGPPGIFSSIEPASLGTAAGKNGAGLAEEFVRTERESLQSNWVGTAVERKQLSPCGNLTFVVEEAVNRRKLRQLFCIVVFGDQVHGIARVNPLDPLVKSSSEMPSGQVTVYEQFSQIQSMNFALPFSLLFYVVLALPEESPVRHDLPALMLGGHRRSYFFSVLRRDEDLAPPDVSLAHVHEYQIGLLSRKSPLRVLGRPRLDILQDLDGGSSSGSQTIRLLWKDDPGPTSISGLKGHN